MGSRTSTHTDSVLALSSGPIQKSIASSTATRIRAISKGRHVLVGGGLGRKETKLTVHKGYLPQVEPARFRPGVGNAYCVVMVLGSYASPGAPRKLLHVGKRGDVALASRTLVTP
jgi:hypothetical protein